MDGANRFAPFNEPDVSAQVERICNSGLLAESHQRLLRYLTALVAKGANDQEFSGDALSVDVFGTTKATSPMGKVIGRQLRMKLLEYYDTVGRKDDIRIDIPAKTFKPRFEPNTARFPPVTDTVASLLWQVRAMLSAGPVSYIWSAFEYLEKANREQPEHPRILVAMALAVCELIAAGYSSPATLTFLRNLVEHLKSGGFEAWEIFYAEACLAALLHWQWDSAYQLFQRAIRMSDGAAQFLPFYTAFLVSQRRFDEAFAIQQEGADYYGFRAAIPSLAVLNMVSGQLTKAESMLREAIMLEPSPHLCVALANVYLAMNNPLQAAATMRKIPSKKDWVEHRMLFLAHAGRNKLALAHLAHLHSLPSDADDFPAKALSLSVRLAATAAATGQSDIALHYVMKAIVVERGPLAIHINIDPVYRSLYAHPAFRELVIEKMKLQLPPY
jgi:hypothetical protein